MNTVAALFALMLVAVAAAGCGGSDIHYSDAKIIDKLNLQKTNDGYAIGSDSFCVVDKKLLNDAGEVDTAAEHDDLGLVIASREGNVGVQGVPVFPPDCEANVKKKLNKLDPAPKD